MNEDDLFESGYFMDLFSGPGEWTDTVRVRARSIHYPTASDYARLKERDRAEALRLYGPSRSAQLEEYSLDEGHKFIAAGLGVVTCATCGGSRENEAHLRFQNNEIGGDYAQCPGCAETWPLDTMVRMLRFKEKLGSVWVCKTCAGFRQDGFASLAAMRERLLITEDEYVRRLEKMTSAS